MESRLLQRALFGARPDMSTERKQLLIVGGINDYPDDLDQFDEVWCINNSFKRFKLERVNRVFFFDNHALIDPDFVHNVNFLDNARVITRWPDPEIPNSEAYPLDEIIAKYGVAYFPCSFAYCLAMAAFEGWQSVTLAGCYHVEDSFEYFLHKPAVEFWIGLLMGSGADVTIHGHSMLLSPHSWESEIYGWETNRYRRLPIDTFAGAFTACQIYPLQVEKAVPPEGIERPRYVSRWDKLRDALPILDEVLT
jgi:hypothetical protein